MMYSWLETDELEAKAQELGLNRDRVSAALNVADVEVVRSVLQQLKTVRTDPYFVEAFACAILDSALEQKHPQVQVVCAILLNVGEAHLAAITELAQLGNSEALALIRQSLNANWRELRDTAASAVINVQYHGSAAQALQDEVENVRFVAAYQLEKRDDTDALIQAISNGSPMVRRIAAWYMGRKRVTAAVKPLIERLMVETDIEALRAVIWSLGVLRDLQAAPALNGLLEHRNMTIVSTVRKAISTLNSI